MVEGVQYNAQEHDTKLVRTCIYSKGATVVHVRTHDGGTVHSAFWRSVKVVTS
jgi:hypothetical protein